MDNDKKAAFVRAYKRQHFSKGGLIRKVAGRKYFDDGGMAAAAESLGANMGPLPDPNRWQNQLAKNPTPARMKSAGGVGGPGSTTNNSSNNPNTGFLGSITGALGLNNNFQAQGANLQAGTNSDQLNSAYNNAQNALNLQETLAHQYLPQAGDAINSQASLANAYTQMMNGQGPNTAQAELAQNTAQNVNQQAALMAGQRGANANAGLMARQIAQQGAGAQQQAVGQAATLQAQQQIAAQQNLQNLAAQQSGQATQQVGALNTAQQNEQNSLQGANTAFNSANVGMQSNVNNTNAQTAAGNQGMMGSILGGVAGGASSILGKLGLAHGGEVESPDHVKLAEMNAASMAHVKKMAWGGPLAGNPLVGNQTVNTMTPMAQPGGYTGPAASGSIDIGSVAAPSSSGNKDLQEGISKGMSDLFASKDGGKGTDQYNSKLSPDVGSLATEGAAGTPTHVPLSNFEAKGGSICPGPHKSHVANYFEAGGKVPAMVSPGEVYLSPDQVHKVVTEGVDPLKVGQKFNGKAKVKGDSLKNDTIPATLEEGGVVIDRKNMSTREKRELFVHKAIARKKAGG